LYLFFSFSVFTEATSRSFPDIPLRVSPFFLPYFLVKKEITRSISAPFSFLTLAFVHLIKVGGGPFVIIDFLFVRSDVGAIYPVSLLFCIYLSRQRLTFFPLFPGNVADLVFRVFLFLSSSFYTLWLCRMNGSGKGLSFPLFSLRN